MNAVSTSPVPAPPARLEAVGVTVRFGGLVALNKVDLRIPPGSMVGLVGPNGAGKSTLFAVLSGLLRPNEGRVLMGGGDVTRATPQARARRGLSRTFQRPELFSGLTVREHLVLGDRVRHSGDRIWRDLLTGGGFRRPSKEEDERVDRLLEALHLGGLQHREAAGLSLGAGRLVEVARALAVEPEVLLLDEPSSGLDMRETEELAATLRRVVEERGLSLLLVEHDVDLVLGMCDTVNVLDFGAMIRSGTPEEIRSDPAVRAAYLGEEPAPRDAEAKRDEEDA
ncbi:branched-chain amino acid transport system ATP-binding protein [Thermomonospora echinospora]|uniref:Branched-chain amino acid transport system ATP-binding protein n=1 Tax=Thermomonospora echinospora TaxID=1992 RepID=A0A1H6DTB7_9ACTN|nr:ABC transporter ATP-binding protein [Thermomonospora echinospora]SEG88508.1 branched-chain amino acid transport system ATP-binding protein [Thermomonospora echinospora]